MSALFLSTDTLDKPLEGYAAHRKTPPSTDSLTQRSYLTHNKTTAIPNRTAAATVVRREAPNVSQSQSIRREARSAERAAGTNPIQNARSAPLFPQPVIRRRPDIAGAAVCLLSGALRRTQEALAALHTKREARFIPFSPNPRRPRTKGPDGFPSECIPQHEAPSKCAKRAIFSPASNPPKTGHRRGRHMFTFRRTPQDARSPRRTPH